MSAAPPPAGRRGSVLARGGLIAGLALLGALLGLLWGIADEPVYEASSSVILVPDPSKGLDPDEQASLVARLAETGGGREVAETAAGELGGDVAGADLLSDVTVEPASEPGTIGITASSETAALAAAAADAYAEALVDVSHDDQRDHANTEAENLEEELAKIDPSSPEGLDLSEKIADAKRRAALDGPLESGAEAELPTSPAGDRPAALWALGGALLGALAGLLVALLLGRRRDEAGEFEPGPAAGFEPAATPAPEPPLPPPLPPEVPRRRSGSRSPRGLKALGAGVIAEVASPAAVAVLDRDALLLGGPDATALGGLADELAGLVGAQGSSVVAIVGSAGGRADVALGTAALAAASGARVLLVEADLAPGPLAARIDAPIGPGLAEYLERIAAPRDLLRTVDVERSSGESGRLICVTGGRAVRPAAELLGHDRFGAMIDRLRRAYELVLIDAGPAPEEVVAQSDVVLAVLERSAGRRETRSLARSLGDDGATGVVLIGRD